MAEKPRKNKGQEREGEASTADGDASQVSASNGRESQSRSVPKRRDPRRGRPGIVSEPREYLPTLEEIEAACLAIQAEWTHRERLARRGKMPQRVPSRYRPVRAASDEPFVADGDEDGGESGEADE